MVLQARLVVGIDVRPDEPRLPFAYVCVSLLQAYAPFAKGLDLAPGEDEAGFEPLDEVVVVPRLAVLRDELFTFGRDPIVVLGVRAALSLALTSAAQRRRA